MIIWKVGLKVTLARLPLLSVRICPSENRTCNLSVASHESHHWTRQPWSIQELSRLCSTRCIDIILNYIAWQKENVQAGKLLVQVNIYSFIYHFWPFSTKFSSKFPTVQLKINCAGTLLAQITVFFNCALNCSYIIPGKGTLYMMFKLINLLAQSKCTSYIIQDKQQIFTAISYR